MKKWLLPLIVVLISGVGLYVFLTLPALQIKTLRIEGNHFTNPDLILAQATQLEGKNVASLLFSYSLKEKILTRHPEIATLAFDWQFPNTVNIKIQEKEIWVSFITNQGNYVVSRDGTILNRSRWNPSTDLDKLIMIKGVPDSLFKDGQLPNNWITTTQKMLENIHFYLPLETLQIEFVKQNDIVLIKDDRLPIRIGTLEDLDLKFRNLKYFLAAHPQKIIDIDYIDLRIEDRVVVKYTKES